MGKLENWVRYGKMGLHPGIFVAGSSQFSSRRRGWRLVLRFFDFAVRFCQNDQIWWSDRLRHERSNNFSSFFTLKVWRLSRENRADREKMSEALQILLDAWHERCIIDMEVEPNGLKWSLRSPRLTSSPSHPTRKDKAHAPQRRDHFSTRSPSHRAFGRTAVSAF